jgi:hypothetical protein
MQSSKNIQLARKEAGNLGRINAGEYSRLIGKPETQSKNARRKANTLGRVNVREYNALAKKRRTKAAPRKRVAAK